MKPCRLLIVEDEYIVARDLQNRLEEIGYLVEACTDNALAAIQLAQELQPDMVLMDICLAGAMDGIDAAIEIRKHQDVPVIFLTAFGEEDMMQRAKAIEPHGYVLKPFEGRELRIVIEMARARQDSDRKLKARERELNAILSSTLEGFLHCDNQGKFLEVNEACCRMLGYEREELLRMCLADVEADKSPEEISRLIAEIERSGATRFERKLRRKDGRLLFVDVNVNGLAACGDGMFCFLRDITERRRSEELMRIHMRLANLPMETDLDGLMQSVLDAAEKLTESCIGFFHFVAPDQENLTLQAWSTNTLKNMCTAEGKGRHYPIREAGVWVDCFHARKAVIHNDYEALPYKMGLPPGHAPIVRELTVPILREGRVEAILGVGNKAWDYTEEDALLVESLATTVIDLVSRKRAEDALKASEEKFKAIANHTVDWENWFGPDGRLLWVNPSVEHTTGYSAKECLAMPGFPMPIICPEDRERVALGLGDMAQSGCGENLEFQFIRKDGKVRWGSVSWQPICDSAGNPLGHRSSVRDVTAYKLAEEQLRLQAMVLDQISDTVTVTDLQGRITYVNKAMERLMGYSKNELIGRSVEFYGDDPLQGSTQKEIIEKTRAGGEYRFEVVNRDRQGHEHLIECRTTAVLDAQGQTACLCGVGTEMTDRRRMELQLRQAQKMEAVGQLAGGVAHDFNNILAAILMYLGVMQMKSDLDPGMRKTLKELEGEAGRAANLTRQLLLFSRRSVMQMKPLMLNEVIANLLKMLGRLIGEHIAVEWHPLANLPLVEADLGMLEQVIMNLSINARDAMARGGQLTIATSVLVLDEEGVKRHPDGHPGHFVCVSVMDTGCGMDAITVGRIFEPFFTTKEAGKGTGLGLATVYGIVAQHKGWIEVESEPGKGSAFRIYLPAMSQAASAERASATEPVSRGHETILLVEDEPRVRQTVGHCLEALGYQVLQARTANEALELWSRHGAHIDLLLTDMVMPDAMTGLELAEKLRAQRASLKVIISSGYSAEMVQQGHPAKSGILYLPKPYIASALATAVRQCLDQTQG